MKNLAGGWQLVERLVGRGWRIPVVAAALLATASPAAAQNREHLQMAAELRMLQEQSQQLALALAQLNEALKAVNARIDASDEATRKLFADQALLQKNIAGDLSVIRERTQDTTTRLGYLSEEIDALRTSLPTLLTQQPAVAPAPVDPADPNAPAVAAPVATPAPVTAAPSTLGLSPNRLFETAHADYTAGQYTLAITGFEQMIRTFPQSERADDAQLYIGDAHYAQNRWGEAISAYNAVIQNYPRSDQLPMARYKRGMAQERLGQPDAARASWEEVIKLHPESQPALLAKQGLDRLGRAPASRP